MISDNGKTLKKMAQHTALEVKFAGFITIAPTGEIWFGLFSLSPGHGPWLNSSTFGKRGK